MLLYALWQETGSDANAASAPSGGMSQPAMIFSSKTSALKSTVMSRLPTQRVELRTISDMAKVPDHVVPSMHSVWIDMPYQEPDNRHSF